jgi:hypothetical protein
VVLSAGLLTQMFQSIADRALPPAPTVQLVLALRQAHLHTLFDLTRRGGVFILLTDVVSTATAPQLRSCADAQLGELLAELIEARNFFTGTNPAAIWQTLTSDPELAVRCAELAAHDPWRWPVTQAHDYLTWAVSVRTR